MARCNHTVPRTPVTSRARDVTQAELDLRPAIRSVPSGRQTELISTFDPHDGWRDLLTFGFRRNLRKPSSLTENLWCGLSAD